MGTNYKPTLNLPNTDFPMRASLGSREPEQVERWREDRIYEKMTARRADEGAERFIMHDGPPYANGHIHHGHILNKTLKDFVVKYRNMAGWLCEFVPGWDCHGLPIEHKVDQLLGEDKREMSKVEVRRECREYADRYVDIQREGFERIMVFADWDNPYRTMSYDYEATTVRELGRFFDSGLVYRGLKPVHWDWDARTALAEAEVEYQKFRTEHVYVPFRFDELPESLAEQAGDDPVHVVIWTTTPWTLPANQAIALHPELDYQLLRIDDACYIMAEGLRDAVLEDCKIETYTVLATFEGRELVGEFGEGRGLSAQHPFLDRESVLLPADYVTLEQGTGCVHTAPGHGQEDFQLGLEFGLDVVCPVDETARFTDEFPEFAGVHVLTANPKIAEKLHKMGHLLNEPGERITIERYPHGWRSKKPVIFRATTQWFVALDPDGGNTPGAEYPLRERALEVIDDDVEWVPEWGHDRIRGMVEGRPDWCLSRQRSWGVPITVVYCTECGEAIATRELAEHVASLVEEHGADVWFEREPADLVPEGTSCPACEATSFRKEEDILDVWFDSGVSWSAVLETKLGVGDRADLYLEGSDQHRGWFQSSLLCGLISRDHSPYDTCLTHGFVVDEDGHKYSKSSKNFESPEKMLEEYGAEILRLWVAGVDYRGDIMLSDQTLDRTADAYRKIRNTFRFSLGNLAGFDPDEHAVPVEQMTEIDRWILHRTAEAVARIEEAYRSYQFHTIYHTLVQLVTVDLSNVFMDVVKDRMYCELEGDAARRSGQTAFWRVLDALVRAAAPILSFTAEEVWSFMPHRGADPDSVFLTDFPSEATEWRDEDLGARWERLFEIRSKVQKAIEERRQSDDSPIGSSQEAHVVLEASGEALDFLGDVEEILQPLFIVSDVDLVEGDVEGVGVEVRHAGGEKCPRCWNYWVEPDSDDEICERCTHVVEHFDLD